MRLVKTFDTIATVNVGNFFHRGESMLRKLICLFVLIAVCGCTLKSPAYVMTHASQQFIAFGQLWQKAYDDHRINDFNKHWVGKTVRWEGFVSRVSPTGIAFDMKPFSGDYYFSGRIVLATTYVPSNFRANVTYVRVTGKIQSVSVLGAIVEAQTITEIPR